MIRLASLFLILLLPQLVGAQGTSDFTIKVFGATDSIDPSSPVIENITPVSSSQINLAWSTSTDNFGVFGYVVFRDGFAIATTTATAYNDTGLSASTTYFYEVAAFDGFPNYSILSLPEATSTLDIFIPPDPEPSIGEATQARVILESSVVIPGTTTAALNLETNSNVQVEVRIGLTSSYEIAYIVGNEYKTDHSVWLDDLSPATQYYYEVIGYTPSGGQTVLERGSFVTLDDSVPFAPANVSRLNATPEGDDVIITYELPADIFPGATVRVVRNYFGYPQSINDGVVIYEGRQETVRDENVLLEWSRVYYSVFVINPNGQISSGAVAVVDRSAARGGFAGSTGASAGQGESSTQDGRGGVTITTEENQPQLGTLENEGFPRLRDFTVTQTDDTWAFSNKELELDSTQPFTISLPIEAIDGQFKSIVATIYDPRGSGYTFSFLLRESSDRQAYEATIAPIMFAGPSAIVVEVFDYDARVASRYETPVNFYGEANATSSTLAKWYWQAAYWMWALLLLVPFITLASLWYLFYKRDRDEDEDNNPAT